MLIKLNLSPKISYSVSAVTSIVFVFYFTYKAFIAYVIHKELYGGGMDALVILRCSLSAVMIFLSFLFFQFMKIKDLKSQRTILNGIFVGWTGILITLLVVSPDSIYFIILTGLASLISLINSFSLIDQIKEQRNTLTEKEIYLLQKLAKKK
tara:strand:+ start:239 stop:694 length:456 start_codon:yes stop_codon:yes gene_type:complete